MTKLSINNLKGEKVSDITLNSEVFGIEVNELAMKKMVRLQLNASRQGTAKVKTRSEVSGGGRKPWKQKGTGRARQGSIRAAQWRKGGIVFGPTPRDYSFKINRKERVLALKSALVNKLNEKKLMVIDNLKLDNFKTKTGVELLNNLKLDGKVLFVASEEAENLYMATRNLNNVLVLFPDEINVYDILNADYVVFDEASIKMVEEALK
ncbi:MAG: 50S ribosomal protein L4 [Mycoplasma sp.]|jgi:large subunit ribosomal protein L4|nr:50S ribosomal protein L4 [Mycoplasma sp.]MDD7149168.1 50S ribosomal protein L4 [Mycoplasma sp.]MDY4543961.1 50S ribosomal protein L4 [Bacilli bacterium]MDY4618509.1 50S ribosomal protein L4 [Bacilli bacterium]CDE37698.1 50S ribosomal protein L4 [Mycoplasma sp. CAG:472]